METASYYFASELGDKRPKIVALLMTNSIEFISLYLAVLHAGHSVMPLDPAYKRLEIDTIIDRVSPAMVILQERYRHQISAESTAIKTPAEILSHSAAPLAGLRLPADQQIASLTFTSGTSGQPKIVPNTHANHIWNIKACSQVWDWTPKDSLLINLPLSHMHGLVICLSGAIYHGNTMYLRQQSFDAKAVLEELASGKISIFTHAPIAYMKMIDQPGNFDLSKVRLFISGSAPFPPKLWQDFKKRFNIEVLETYGTTETGRIAANTMGDIKLGSPGKVLPGVDLKLSAEGEILVKSGGLFPGYWNNPSATAKGRAPGGYWRTGDIGELQGKFVILKGRAQELIRRSGYSVSPRDVEWALLKNPAIKDIHVMGRAVADKTDDELIYFIVTELSDQAIADYSKQHLLFAWRPDKIIRLDKLPRTRNGKPHIRQLQEIAA